MVPKSVISELLKIPPDSKLKKKPTRIKKATTHQAERNEKYKLLRDLFIQEYPVCQICKEKQSCSLHHRARRKGLNLFRFFMSLCRECHLWVEINPIQSRQMGYIIQADPNKELDEGAREFKIKDRLDDLI